MNEDDHHIIRSDERRGLSSEEIILDLRGPSHYESVSACEQ